MAGKSPVQGQLDELEKLVQTLAERLDHVRKEVEGIDGEQSKASDSFWELKTNVAVLNERFGELKRVLEDSSRKRWALLPPVIGAVINVLLAALVAYLVARK